MIRYTRSEEETLQVGAVLGACLRGGDVVLLHGEMGAGKSVFCRGVARGLGIEGPIPSPTFTLLNIHEGSRFTLYHFDLYRLQSAEELYEMGLQEYIGADGVTLIEWPECAWEAMPERHLEITMQYDDEAEARRQIIIRPRGGFDLKAFEQKLEEEGA